MPYYHPKGEELITVLQKLIADYDQNIIPETKPEILCTMSLHINLTVALNHITYFIVSESCSEISLSQIALYADLSEYHTAGLHYNNNCPLVLSLEEQRDIFFESMQASYKTPKFLTDLIFNDIRTMQKIDDLNDTNLAERVTNLYLGYAQTFLTLDQPMTLEGENAINQLYKMIMRAQNADGWMLSDAMYPLHNESYELLESIESDIYESASAIDSMFAAYGETEVSNNLERIISILHIIAFHFIFADGDMSDEEAAFFYDMRCFFGLDERSPTSQIASHTLLMTEVIQNPELKNVDLEEITPILQVIDAYDSATGRNVGDRLKSSLFKFANSIAKADGTVTTKEERELQKLKKILYPVDSFSESYEITLQREPYNRPLQNKSPLQSESISVSKNLEELLAELNTLIGLERVKNDVQQLVNFLKVQQLRESKGMGQMPISRHLVFYGNPGTGKTTVARLLSQIYKSLGILSKGHLIETDRAGLVAGYVGQTAMKVKEVAKSALGGILFIDEAYTLSSGNNSDYGQEAIDTLLKFMEDNRDDLVVIVAGYTDKMNNFLSSNPGLRSRFNKYFFFDDYTPIQLVDIFELFAQKSNYVLSGTSKEIALKLFSILHETRDEAFGNGRLARNLFEVTVSNHANRIISIPNVNEHILLTIEPSDIPELPDEQSRLI